jgi:hypothetical protein
MQENTQLVHLSAVVHVATKIGHMPSNKKRAQSGCYMLLMTMMRGHSQLSQTVCSGRILACNGQFLFLQDMPMMVLKEAGMLQGKLDDFVLKTVKIRGGFHLTLKEDHCRLGAKELLSA